MRIETQRLLVRPFEERDLDALCAVLSDPETMKYIEPPFSCERTARFLWEAGLCELPLVFAAEDHGGVIGHVIFHACGAPDRYEVGWVLRRDRWGRGYASELTAALIAEGRARGLKSLLIECDPRQAATRRIAEAFGFRPAGREDGLDVFLLEL